MTIKQQESEKQSKDHQIRSLQDEIAAQDESIAKLNKEKKHQEEINRKLMDDVAAEQDKVSHLNKAKAKLEQSLDQMEDTLNRERRQRQELDKQKRKIEGELKVFLGVEFFLLLWDVKILKGEPQTGSNFSRLPLNERFPIPLNKT